MRGSLEHPQVRAVAEVVSVIAGHILISTTDDEALYIARRPAQSGSNIRG